MCHGGTLQSTSGRESRRNLKVAALAMVAAISGIATVLAHVVPHLDKQPMHTSVLSGQ
jgi:hypothetical protein